MKKEKYGNLEAKLFHNGGSSPQNPIPNFAWWESLVTWAEVVTSVLLACTEVELWSSWKEDRGFGRNFMNSTGLCLNDSWKDAPNRKSLKIKELQVIFDSIYSSCEGSKEGMKILLDG